MKNLRFEFIILALAIIVSSIQIGSSIKAFSEKDRCVNVKGLAEREVMADKVTWPLMYKSIGNDLQTLYEEIKETNRQIVSFLKEKGIGEEEIIVNASEIIDLKAERYGNNENVPYRYNVSTVITVTSDKVELVRNLVKEQGELLKRGIAITSGDYRYQVQYDFTELNSIKPEMIEEATKNARLAAEKFAKDSGSRLGKIRSANQGQFSIYDRDANTPHIKKVRVVTTVSYLLKN